MPAKIYFEKNKIMGKAEIIMTILKENYQFSFMSRKDFREVFSIGYKEKECWT
jgi:hypothetical protein